MTDRQRSARVVFMLILKICPRRSGLLMGDRSPKSHGVRRTPFAPEGDRAASASIIL